MPDTEREPEIGATTETAATKTTAGEVTATATPSDRTRVRRVAERGAYDRPTIDRILDQGLVCHVGIAGDGGQPFVIPMAYARDGDRLLLHGSVISRLIQRAVEGVPVCVTVTHLDALVLARSTFHHSMNYRSVVVLGTAVPIRDREQKLAALDALVEHLVPGRSADARGPSEKELAATEILALPLDEASAKIRSGPPKDDKRDLELDVWAGLVPLRTVPGAPETAPDGKTGLAVPEYVARYRR